MKGAVTSNMLNISKKQQINALVSILHRETTYKSLSDLENELHLSRRSVFYWLKQLNNRLEKMDLDPVQHLIQGGYFLTKRTEKALIKFTDADYFSQLNGDERRAAMTWLLIQHVPRLSLTDLCNRFSISRNTVIRDLRMINSALPDPVCIENTPHGKVLTGDEKLQRRWVYAQILKRNPAVLHDLEKLPQLQETEQALYWLQQQTKNLYSEDSAKTLTCYISWLLARVSSLGPLPADVQGCRTDTIGLWCRHLFHRYVKVTSGEAAHLREMLLTAQLQSTGSQAPIMKRLVALSRQVVNRFHIISGVDISSPGLIQSLATHLLPTYYRFQYGVLYRYPNLSGIKTKYAYLMQLTKYAIYPFEKYIGKPLTDDELALITVYFGGELKKMPASLITSEPDVFLVCTSGIGTSRLLSQQLSVQYPEIVFTKPMSIKDFQACHLTEQAPKAIITTTPLESDYDIPVIHVQPILSDYDFHKLDLAFRKIGLLHLNKKSVQNTVKDILNIVFDYARIEDFNGLTKSLTNYLAADAKVDSSTVLPNLSISELIPLSNIKIIDKVNDWKDAVYQSFEPLIVHQDVGLRYVRKIIELTEQKGPYMVVQDPVMLAHATQQEGVNNLAMSLLLLHHSAIIQHSNVQKEIKVIFCLAPIDNVSHVKALSQLLNLLQNNELYEQLMDADTPREAHLILEKLGKGEKV